MNGAPETAPPGILLVEDDETSRVVTREMLRRLGFLVHTAVDGVEGLEVFRALGTPVQLVISDLLMPRLDGTGVLKELRSLAPDLPVLIASGFWEEHTPDELTALGACGFLRKPYGLGELAAAVGAALGRKLPIPGSRVP